MVYLVGTPLYGFRAAGFRVCVLRLLEDAGIMAFHITPLLLPMPTSAAERDGDTVVCRKPDRQLVVGLGISCYCWPCRGSRRREDCSDT